MKTPRTILVFVPSLPICCFPPTAELLSPFSFSGLVVGFIHLFVSVSFFLKKQDNHNYLYAQERVEEGEVCSFFIIRFSIF